MDQKKIGRFLKELRKEKVITPEQIANVKESYTGKFLGPVLEQTKKFMKAAKNKK